MHGLTATAVIAASVLVLYAETPQQSPVSTQTPQFRADVQYVEIPLIAVDERGQFVNDVGQRELQLLEDGRPQKIVNFQLVTVPAPRAAAIPKPSAANRVEPMSVADLQRLEGRIYLLVVDDYHIRNTDSTRTRSILQDFVRSHMGANDAAALVSTSGAQGLDFTQDRAALLNAVEHLRGSFTTEEPDSVRESRAQSTLATIARLTTDLDTIERRRKALLLLTPFIGCAVANGVLRERDISIFDSGQRGSLDQSQAFEGNGPATRLSTFTCPATIVSGIQSAIHSNTTVYAIDPRGSEVTDFVPLQVDGRGGPGSALRRADRLAGTNNSIGDAMFPLATETGGFVVTRSNAFGKALDRIVREQSVYYLLGYYSTNTTHDGKQRITRIDIQRNRVTLNYRRTYFAPAR